MQVMDIEWKLLDVYFMLIWDMVQEVFFCWEVVQYLFVVLLYNIKYICMEEVNDIFYRFLYQEEIFWWFIVLVNEFSKNECIVGFYVDKLCLILCYLNILIWQVSYQIVMEWINQFVIFEVKVLLKYSNLFVY